MTRAEFYVEENIPLLEDADYPRLVHRDFKPGNILAREGIILGVIDWENAEISFAEEDFAQMQLLVWDKDSTTKDAFEDGYKIVREMPNWQRMLPLMRVLKSLGIMGLFLARGIVKEYQEEFNAHFEKLRTLIVS